MRTHKNEPREGEHKVNCRNSREDISGLGEAGDCAIEELVNPTGEGGDDQKHGNLDDNGEYKDSLWAESAVSIPTQKMQGELYLVQMTDRLFITNKLRGTSS